MISSWSNPKTKIMTFGFKSIKKKNWILTEYVPMALVLGGGGLISMVGAVICIILFFFRSIICIILM